MGCIFNQNQVLICAAPPQGGLAQQAIYEYNYSDWRDMVNAGLVTFGVNGSITGITNAPTVQAYKKDVPNNSIVLGSAPNKVTGAFTTFLHTVNYPLIANKQLEKNVVQSMTVEKRVCIVIKNSGEAELYGSEQGLILVNDTYNPVDPDFGGMIPIELSTDPDGAKETKKPISIFDTDFETTIALIEGLTTPGV